MTNQPDLKMQLICSLRGKDVELSEDLYRRMGPCSEVPHLNSFFHSLLAQYPSDTMALRSSLVNTTDYQTWYTSFLANVFPYLVKKRLPSCTDTTVTPIYGTPAK